jgi:hypothetical protein
MGKKIGILYFMSFLKNLTEKLRHAFTTQDLPFTEDEIALLDKVAKGIVKRGLASPAAVFLESVRPLNFIGSQIMLFFNPILSLIVNTVEYERLALIFEKRESISILIGLIEKYSNESRKS